MYFEGTFTFRAFGRRFYPKRLITSTFIEGDGSTISLWYIKIRMELVSSVHSCEVKGTRFTIAMFLPRQYIHPGDAVKLGQAELLVIDEAAAIPLPLVKNLLGPYLVFMASTINGFVGVVVLPLLL